METQKIVNLWNSSEKEFSKFPTKKWYVIDSETKNSHSHYNPEKFLTKSIELNLCNYSGVYVLVLGDITVTRDNANTKVAFKNCAPFNKRRKEINDTFVDETDFIDIAIPVYKFTEYSDNYSDSSVYGSSKEMK